MTSVELTYASGLSALQQLEAEDKLTAFAVGDIIRGLVFVHGEQIVKQLAADLGRSYYWVRQRQQVVEAFPPERREELWGSEEPPPPISWVHHRIAAITDLPEYWLREAIDKEWSTRQLQEAINGQRPDGGDDIIVSYDQVAGELHIQLSTATATSVSQPTRGILRSVDSGGRTVSVRLALPVAVYGRSVRLRRVR